MPTFSLSQAALNARPQPGLYRIHGPGRVYGGRAANLRQRLQTYYRYARILGCNPTGIRVDIRYQPVGSLVAGERRLIRGLERGISRGGPRVMNYDRELEGEFFG